MLVYLDNTVRRWVLHRLVMVHKRRRNWYHGQVGCTLVHIRSAISFDSQCWHCFKTLL